MTFSLFRRDSFLDRHPNLTIFIAIAIIIALCAVYKVVDTYHEYNELVDEYRTICKHHNGSLTVIDGELYCILPPPSIKPSSI